MHRFAPRRGLTLGVLLLAAAALGCFTGDEVAQQPCESDDDCGGAFAGLEDIIEHRMSAKTLGFGVQHAAKKELRQWELLKNVQSEESALKAVAQTARAQKAGARGLRTILEKAMLDVMYEIPSSNNIREVIVNEDTISQGKQPVVLYENEEAAKEAS